MGIRQKPPLRSSGKKFGQGDFPDGVGTRHHVHDTTTVVHEREQLAGKQVRSDIVDACGTCQTVDRLDVSRVERTGIVHEQIDGLITL